MDETCFSEQVLAEGSGRACRSARPHLGVRTRLCECSDDSLRVHLYHSQQSPGRIHLYFPLRAQRKSELWYLLSLFLILLQIITAFARLVPSMPARRICLASWFAPGTDSWTEKYIFSCTLACSQKKFAYQFSVILSLPLNRNLRSNFQNFYIFAIALKQLNLETFIFGKRAHVDNSSQFSAKSPMFIPSSSRSNFLNLNFSCIHN